MSADPDQWSENAEMAEPSRVNILSDAANGPMNAFGADVSSRIFFYTRDIQNMLRYGVEAPIAAQLIFINPNSVKLAIRNHQSKRIDTGLIKGGDWDLLTHETASVTKIRGVKKRIVSGDEWESTALWKQNLGYMENGVDGIKTVEDIKARYKKMDRFIAVIREGREAAFKTRSEINPNSFREAFGVMINIGRDGDLLFGMRGCHRLGIAQALDLACIPAELGIVHEAAVKDGVWRKNLIPPGSAFDLRQPRPVSGVAQQTAAAADIPETAPTPKRILPLDDPSQPTYTLRYSENTASGSIEYRDNRESHLSGITIPKYERLIPVMPGNSMFELGAAEGILSLTLAPYKERVRAVELTPIRHNRAVQLKDRWRELGKQVDNCEMLQADIFDKPELMQGFDTFVASRVLYYFGSRLYDLMTEVSKNFRYICLIGNPKRAAHYHKGKYKELGKEFAWYTTLAGMSELVERYGYRVISTIETGDPVMIAERITDASAIS